MNQKIRPNRILKGWAKAILNQHTEVGDQRMAVCNSCPNKTAIGTCAICLCPLITKTKVLEEACPADKWIDVKRIPGQYVALRLHETDKATINIEDNKVIVAYNENFEYNSLEEDTELNIDFINLRGDNDDFSAVDIKLKRLYLSHCGCFRSTINNKEHTHINQSKVQLNDGEAMTITLRYDTKLFDLSSDKDVEVFSKVIRVVSDNDTFQFKVIGGVDKPK